jgi:acyl transferase domain-containing protein
MACNDVAIVGFAFRLPGGVEDEDALWSVLQNRRNLMTEWPESRLNVDSFYDKDPENLNRVGSTRSLIIGIGIERLSDSQ